MDWLYTVQCSNTFQTNIAGARTRMHVTCASCLHVRCYMHIDTYCDCIARAIVASTLITHDMCDTCLHTNTCDVCILCVLAITMHTCTPIHMTTASGVQLLRAHWAHTTCTIHARTQIHVTCASCVCLHLRCIHAHRYIWRLHRTCPCCEYIDHARHVRYMPAHKYMWRVHFVCAYNYDAYVHTDTYDDCIVRAIVARTMSTHDMYDTCPHTNTCDSCIVCVLTFTMHACSPIHSTIASCVQMFRVHWAHTTCTTQPGPECPRVCMCTLLCICACVLHMCVPACIHVCAIHANKLHIVTCDHCCIVRRLDIYRQIMIDIRAATFMCWRRHEVSFHTLSVWMR